MVLNLMRSEETDVEHVIRHSFHQFQADRAVPDMHATFEELKYDSTPSIIIFSLFIFPFSWANS